MKHIKLSNQTTLTQNNSVPSSVPSDSADTGILLSFPTSGPLVIPMTNDYLFRALLQQNNHVLKGLICSLLHLSAEEIHTVEITNPIELGTSFTDKTFILDVRVSLNDLVIINLELQVINQHNWVERSLSYLCRSFDHLQAGRNYLDARPVVQIGLLNYTLFAEHPEFYATYQLLNVKNHSLYSDKLRLSVLDLTQIDLATEEDRSHQLDCWAGFFKATTWEEVNMLAQKNEAICKAAGTVYQLTQEERIRMECEAREDYYRTQRDIQYLIEKQTAENEALIQKAKALLEERNILTDQNNTLTDEISALADQNNSLADQNNTLTDEISALADQNNLLADQNSSLTDEINALADQNNSLASQNNALADEVKELTDKLSRLQRLLEMQGLDLSGL